MENDVPAEVSQALDRIWRGAKASELESATLDFKSDPYVHAQAGSKRDLAMTLSELVSRAAVCFANGTAGDAYLVLGVEDKLSGPGAFTGTQQKAEKIERWVFDHTVPNLRVQTREIVYQYCRLLIMHVPPGMAVYTDTQGKARQRRGTSCEILGVHEMQRLQFDRANPDATHAASAIDVSTYSKMALEDARTLLAQTSAFKNTPAAIPTDTKELLAVLGLLTSDEKPTVAAELLFTPAPPAVVRIRHLRSAIPGGEPTITEFSEPLLSAYLRLKEMITTYAGAEVSRIAYPSGQEISIPTFPARAIDEAITNAIAHRDWNITSPIVVEQSPTTLGIWSPGALPPGVSARKLLTVQSVPRNAQLMQGLRTLGIVEESSRGFDRMWVSMLSSGRRPPEIEATDFHVDLTFAAGTVNEAFVRGLHELSQQYGNGMTQSVPHLIILDYLCRKPTITLNTAVRETQSKPATVVEILAGMVNEGIVDATGQQNDTWQLSEKTKRIFGEAVVASPPLYATEQWIEEQLTAGKSLANKDVVAAIGAKPAEVSEVFRRMRYLGTAVKDPKGPSRGPGTRWVAPPNEAAN